MCRVRRRRVDLPGSLPSSVTVDEGYAIQDAVVDRQSRTEGPVVGYKLGFTNEAVQSDLGVDAPVYGRIFEDTVGSDDRFERGALVDPLIEPEIVFVLDRALSPPVTRLDVMAATRFVAPAIEIVDSRIEGGRSEPARRSPTTPSLRGYAWAIRPLSVPRSSPSKVSRCGSLAIGARPEPVGPFSAIRPTPSSGSPRRSTREGIRSMRATS